MPANSRTEGSKYKYGVALDDFGRTPKDGQLLANYASRGERQPLLDEGGVAHGRPGIGGVGGGTVTMRL